MRVSRRWGLFGVLVMLMARLVAAGAADIEPEVGRTVPSINWIDETGQARQLSQFSGFPLVLLPIYTRCRTACVANVAQLKSALTNSQIDPSQVRVMLFSFDPNETPATLAAFRKRENVPLSWYVGTASQSDIDALLDAIGFQAAKAGSEFMHANLVVFLDPNLRIAKWIYGTDYSTRDVDAGLKVAAGQSDWLGRHSEWFYAGAVFGASVLCVMLGNYLLHLRRGHQVMGST